MKLHSKFFGKRGQFYTIGTSAIGESFHLAPSLWFSSLCGLNFTDSFSLIFNGAP